jgi:hypothetical protein
VLRYLSHFAGENQFGYSVIDINTHAMAIIPTSTYRRCSNAGWQVSHYPVEEMPST